MKYDTSELCDIYQEDVNVVEPLFSNFGGRSSFGGQIITVKCFEDNGLLYELLEQNGRGRILLVDGGGSMRRALIDADLARLAVQNEWEGLVVYGAVRQVDDLEELDLGIQAIAAIPVGAAGDGIGESDVRVNFGGVTFFSGDHLYADNTGIILPKIRWISSNKKAGWRLRLPGLLFCVTLPLTISRDSKAVTARKRTGN